MKATKKDECKKLIREILKTLEVLSDEAERNNTPIYEVCSDLLFQTVSGFSQAIQTKYGYNESTARNAINEMESDGEISKEAHGYFELKRSSKKIDKIVKHQLFATPLPLKNQNDSAQYIEVSDNMSPFLAELFNKSMHMNDKRFYSVAPNLLLLLDLAIPESSEIAVKETFNLSDFLNDYGIAVRDYNIVHQEIKGTTYTEMLEQDYFEKTTNQYQGKLNNPRHIKPRTSNPDN